MRVVTETAKHAASDQIRIGFAHSACGHAMVRSPDEDAYSARLEYIVDDVGNLGCEFFLDLQAFGESFNNPGEFADAHHAPIGHVSNPRPSQDRCHVMLAKAFEADAAQHNHFVIAFDLVKGLF